MHRGYWLALAVALALAMACGGGADTIAPGPEPGEDGGAADGEAADGGSEGAAPRDGSIVPRGPDGIEIVVEPSDKAQALLTAVQGARSSVHVTMYLMNDKRFIAALVAQHDAGHDVKVLLNKTFPGNAGTNQATFAQLQAAGVAVAWAPSTFTLTHEKCVLVDAAQAWIMTMNLETTSSANREYLAIDREPGDVMQAEAMFAADFSAAPFAPSGGLVVAPVNARAKLLALIQSATKSVDLEGEELSDTKIVAALVAAKQSGAAVRIVLADNPPSTAQATAVDQLKAAGIPVVTVASPYIHAKALVVDGASAYVGSENFTTGSLQYNRELGIITVNAAAVGVVGATIAKDFSAGTAL